MTLTVLNPVQEAVSVTSRGAERLSTLDGKVLGLYSNGKFNAENLLELIGERLGSEFDLAKVVHGKYMVSRPMEPGEWVGIEECDAIVLAIGDCGSCSSSGAMNAIQLEKAGIPALLVSTTPFLGVVKATSQLGGMPDFDWAVVEHPVGNATHDELGVRADHAVAEFHRIVLADPGVEVGMTSRVLSSAR